MTANEETRLLVIQPDPLDQLNVFGDCFAEAGVAVRTVQPFVGEPVPPTLDADGLLVLGGSMSSVDDETYPWLEDVRALMRRAADAHKPALGLCLGGQLMAQAFGGETAIGDQGTEAGVISVRWRPEAVGDPVFGALPSPFPVGAMHRDMILKLPPAAVWLGESDLYPHQAYRVGDTSWGVQFHPEVDVRLYQKWVDAFTAADPGDVDIDIDVLRAGLRQFRLEEPAVLAGTRVVATRFAALLRRRTRHSVAPTA